MCIEAVDGACRRSNPEFKRGVCMRKLAKYLLLSQAASDAGKGYVSHVSENSVKAVAAGYGLKDDYIRQAISEAKKHHRVHVSIAYDYGMCVVIFDLEGFGQMSFHSFTDFGQFVKSANGQWNGVPGGSPLTAKKLARKFNLPHYKKEKGKN